MTPILSIRSLEPTRSMPEASLTELFSSVSSIDASRSSPDFPESKIDLIASLNP